MPDLDRLLRGLCTYQDIVVDGVALRRGVRDCEGRWRQIEPHLPTCGTLLDVGANFAWFAQRWCEGGAERSAVAIEADLRSAAVARYALAANRQMQVVLCTALAEAAALRPLAGRGRFDAALCLSILHWIPDHREFLAALGRIADRIFIEQPDPCEEGAGRDDVRREIGPIGPYLAKLFPDRPTHKIAERPSHLDEKRLRELWLVGPPAAESLATSPNTIPSGLDLADLARLDIAWPPQSWWRSQLDRLRPDADRCLRWTPNGLEAISSTRGDHPSVWSQTIARIPETNVSTWRRRLAKKISGILRRLRF